ncbi:TetR/AcrR family transcriptional regulator [Rhodococcus sp. HNM0569]|uniref:TetR/AcrR family transcriptional regulator n=1 Tax=Rhodococcus sp. HNM0569 TaxID=2716340 RepID=UPI00146E6115|nr:TetR/AcrR family transcriptional regulator [Rhodococcus sp. HNM0569]NLU83900.1 TetR/AcrR family transcriptional regulator [Rhodococcus sp. HNM0569]
MTAGRKVGAAATGKRTRLSPGERRRQLVELGVEMLAERTLDGISIDEIADQAGVSRGLLFHYFASKDDFLLEIVREASEMLLQRTDPALVTDSTDPAEVLRAVIGSYVDYAAENSITYVSLLRGKASGDPDMAALFDRTRVTMIERTLAQLPALGVERNPRLEIMVRGWIAFVEEATITWLRDPRIGRDELVELDIAALPGLALSVAPELTHALLDGPAAPLP